MTKRSPKRRNEYAAQLASPQFRKRVVPSKKAYKRKPRTEPREAFSF